MRTTLTLDADVAALLEKENRRTGEPMKHTVNRILRSGLLETNSPARRKRFTVQTVDTGIRPEQWSEWQQRKLEDILEEAERH